LVIFNAGDLEF